MFSVMSVCLQKGSHVTITHDTLDLTRYMDTLLVPDPTHPQFLASLLLMTTSGRDWKSVQAYSLEDLRPPPPSVDICWAGKQAVRILLECFLFGKNFKSLDV